MPKLGACGERMDPSPGVSLPLLSPQQANHFCGLFWDPFHFCNSLGYAEPKGQIYSFTKWDCNGLTISSLGCTLSLFFVAEWCMVEQKEHVLFCFISLPVLARGQICKQLPTVLLHSTSPHNGHIFSTGLDPDKHFVSLPELFQQCQQHLLADQGLCVLEGGVSAGFLAQMHGSNSF